MISMLAFVFKIIRPISFSAVENVSFPQSNKFSKVKELFHSQINFPKSRNFYTIKEVFHNQKNLPQ